METDKENLYQSIAAALKEAEKTCVAIQPVSKAHTDMEIKDAYRVQMVNVDRELLEGYKITGKKVGLTSLAMQKSLGVSQADYGHLFDKMEVKNNTLVRETLLNPKVEGEIAFVLKEDVKGPNVTAADIIEATDYVVASIEIVDSRIADWKINIIDTIADNASSAMYVTACKKIDPKKINLKTVSMELYKNGEMIHSGVGADVLGDPAYSVAWLANALWEYGVTLEKGEVVLSGSLTAALPAEAGDDFKAVFSELGEVSVRFI